MKIRILILRNIDPIILILNRKLRYIAEEFLVSTNHKSKMNENIREN